MNTTNMLLISMMIYMAISTGFIMHAYSDNHNTLAKSINEEFSKVHNQIVILAQKKEGVNLTDRAGYYNGIYYVVATDSDNIPYIIDVALHESGHHFMNTVMNKQAKKEWNATFYNTSQYITEYASTHPGEDFAESFMHVIDVCYNDDKAGDLHPKKAIIFKKYIKPYFEVC